MRLHLNAILLLIALAALLALSGCGNKEKNKNEESSGTTPAYDEYNTYVFFGVDSRAGEDDWKEDDSTGTEGAPSSDVIMLVNIDEESRDVQVCSVYRDTMMDVSGSLDLQKCNTAYRDAGPYGAIGMLEENLDLRISGYVSANFMAVADAIDALGGVDVDIESEKLAKGYEDKGTDSLDIINALIDELNEIYDRDAPHIEKTGMQTLSGIQAVAYSRLRYTEGSDMQRTVRQRDIVSLMLEKLKAADTTTQHEVLQQMYPSVDTDMAESELMDLFDVLVGYDMGNMQGFPYYKSSAYLDELWFMIPCDLETNVTELHKRVYGEPNYAPSASVKTISKAIEEKSGLGAGDSNRMYDDAY